MTRMNQNPKHCPTCDSTDTKTVHTDFYTYADTIEQVIQCRDCPTEWVVAYTDAFVREIITEPDP